MRPSVLFVSKPIAPPFQDGTKCLVRDVALELERVRPIVMSTRSAPALESAAGRSGRRAVDLARIYRAPGRYAPALSENLRAAAFLLTTARADLWHFVFAPNPRASRIARLILAGRRVPSVQTVASPPKSFERLDRILFGDVVVAQSRWTLDRIEQAWLDQNGEKSNAPRTVLVPPPLGPLTRRSEDAVRAVRQSLVISETAPIFVYPGDLETSGGAEAVAAALPELVRELPDAVVVFAYRAKSPRAHEVASSLGRRLDPRHARFAATLEDVLPLIQTSSAVLFPVDDLWGKVDLPIVLLEAMALGVPIVTLDAGPLQELGGVLHVRPGDAAALVRSALDLVRDQGLRERVTSEQRAHVISRNGAEVVARAYEKLYFELLERSSRPAEGRWPPTSSRPAEGRRPPT